MSDSTRTYQTRLGSQSNAPLLEYSILMAQVEHKLFADLSKGKESGSLKSSYLVKYGITARQFNATRVNLEGKIDSIKQRQTQLIEEKKQQIEALEKKLIRLKNKKVLHQKKRRLSRLQSQLQRLQKDRADGRIALCFGSRKLFHAQFHLEENGYASQTAWKEAWLKTRNSEIFILGSKDETAGNQSCTATLAQDGSVTLRVRMPDQLIPQFGKYQLIPNLRFAHGHEAITAAILDCNLRRELYLLNDPAYKSHGQAITFRFKNDSKGWRIFVSLNVKMPKPPTQYSNGVIAVDINSDHLAVAEIDRFGNLIQGLTIPLNLNTTTNQQTRALVGDASAQIIAFCEKTRKSLVIEALDFQKKRTQLRERYTSYARMLSSFAYQSVLAHLKSRGASKGVQVHSVNPAFTSLIGQVKFAKRYGISIHMSAALCIGRRFLGFSEQMPQSRRDIPDGKGGHVTLDLPVRNRTRHVWHQWKQLNQKLPAALTAHFRTVKNRSSSSRKTTLETDALPDFIGAIPVRESSAPLFC
ncbi:MAG: transposase [Chlamydiota bacterium]